MGLEEFIECLTAAADKTFPKVRQSRKQYLHAKIPWITHDILKSIQHQYKLFSKFKKSRDENDHRKYKSFRYNLTRIKEAAKAALSKLS